MADALTIVTQSYVENMETVGTHKIIKDVGINSLRLHLIGTIFRRADRHGKWLLLRFQSPEPNGSFSTLCIHNSMHGHIRIFMEEDFIPHKHDRFMFTVSNLNEETRRVVVVYRDIRCWGQIHLYREEYEERPKFLRELGRDTLLQYIDGPELWDIFKKYPEKAIGNLLLRQDLVAGIGNIYRSEILYHAKILPERWVQDITVSEWAGLAVQMYNVLEVAHRMGGSSVADFENPSGNPGRAQNGHLVYGRAGQQCLTCKTGEIKVELMSKRKIFFCRLCQT